MKKYLDFFELKIKFRNIKPFKCMFKEGLNIIVGENGSGKSTMIHILTNKDFLSKKSAQLKLINPKQKIDYSFFDTEKQNPRSAQLSGNEDKEVYEFSIHSHFASHGEAIFPIINTCRTMKNKVIFIDEPEAGVSLSNQEKIYKTFKRAEKNNCQIIVATHSYLIIKKAKEVFSLDKKKWILSKDFLKGV